MTTLLLGRDLHDSLVAMSRAALPYEACGVIGGERVENGWRALSIHPVKNSLASATAFALDGAGMIAAEDRIDAAGNELIGVWHSHPTSAPIPSDTDLADASRYDPAGVFVHVLVSMQGFAPQVRAYQYGSVSPGLDPYDGEPLRKYWLVRFGS